jgi:hypothetical protein
MAAFEASLQLLNFEFDADPKSASQNNADPRGSGSATQWIRIRFHHFSSKRIRIQINGAKSMRIHADPIPNRVCRHHSE